ncbi:MAG: T9SS type A sorting domain-containing protein, partial [Bacteroidetes bacterium]|nr:T9SS type A sorting domain-containing protein [Bacteroidota bacterium]
NASGTQPGQKCWVKANYRAPEVVLTNEVKNKCACTASPTSGVEDFSNLKVSIYPNPAFNELTIEAEQLEENADILVTDLSGKEVLKSKINKGNVLTKLDISSLEKGCYSITIKITSGYIIRPLIKI